MPLDLRILLMYLQVILVPIYTQHNQSLVLNGEFCRSGEYNSICRKFLLKETNHEQYKGTWLLYGIK